MRLGFDATAKPCILLRNLVAFVLLISGVSFIEPHSAYGAPSGIVGSINFGTGNYLKTADSSDFVMGAGDFTFETWVHPTALPGSNYTGIIGLGLPSDLTSAINGHEIRIAQSFAGDGKLGFMAPDNASSADVWTATSAALELGRWSHLALVRNGSTLTLYLNGTSVASRTGVSFTHTGYPAKSNIGAFFASKNGGWSDGEFTGAIADVRLVKGTAVYTSNFTAPTSPLSVVASTQTKLLLNSNYSSNNTFADFAYNSAPSGLQPSAGGTPTSLNISPYQAVDSAITLTRSSSMQGNSDATTAPLQKLSAYTVEGWAKPTSSCIGSGIRCEILIRDGDYDIVISEGVFQFLAYHNGNQTAGFVATTIVPEADKWVHVALTRDGTSLKFYVNAVLVYSYTLGSAVASSYNGYPFRIGYAGYGSTYFDGQIDEVKLWNVARTQTQLATGLYSAPTLSDTTLLAYYDFNSGFGTTVPNRKIGAATTSFLTLTGSPTWSDVKVQTTSGNETTITIPRAYINVAGGFSLPSTVTQFDYLVVGGGGGGGNGYNNGGGGGGGGGMVLTGTYTTSASAVISARVGVGGAGGIATAGESSGSTGDSSILGSVTSLGGGGGSASRTYVPSTRGGGAKQNGSISAGTGGGGGGAGGGGGGGGGSGSAGSSGVGAAAGSGGSGLSVKVGSISDTYGAGGAGAPGSTTQTATNASANLGNGGSAGSGASGTNRAGGNGGTGTIIIYYFSGTSSLTFSYSSAQAIFRTLGTISVTADTAGYVSFYERGKIISGCKNRPTNGSRVATCSWKPATRGAVTILTVFTSSSGATANTSKSNVINVASRSGNR